MQQKVTDRLSLWRCYRIDKQFFVCLDDIFKKSEPDVSYLITIWCKNVKYSFQDLTEFFEYSNILANRIVKVRFDAHFPISERGYITNDISIMFSNEQGESTSGEITFDFYDDKSYLILKNQIETLLKNCKLDYSIFSNTAIIPFFDLIILISIIIYTRINGIVYPRYIQYIIMSIFLLLMIISILPPVKKIKRFIFPSNEISFGVNIKLEARAHSIRNFISKSVLLGIAIGIVANFLSKFLF